MQATPTKSISFEVSLAPTKVTSPLPYTLAKKLTPKRPLTLTDISQKLNAASARKQSHTAQIIQKAQSSFQKVISAECKTRENAVLLLQMLEEKQASAAVLKDKQLVEKRKVALSLGEGRGAGVQLKEVNQGKMIAAEERRKAMEKDRKEKLSRRHSSIQETLRKTDDALGDAIEGKLAAANERRKAIEKQRLEKLSRRHSSINGISAAAAACPPGNFIGEKLEAAEERRKAMLSGLREQLRVKEEHAILVRKRKSLGSSSVDDLVKLKE